MLQIRRILQQRLNGKSNRDIAKELHISRDTVNEYVKQLTQLGKAIGELLHLNDQELSSQIYKEHPSTLTDWRYTDLQQRIPSFCDELKKPHATRMIFIAPETAQAFLY
jgi:DNA-binding Lrp family transcriptional regulator